MIWSWARAILPATALLLVSARTNHQGARANPKSSTSPFTVKVEPGLRCFESKGLRVALSGELGDRLTRGWRLQLQRPPGDALRLSLYREGKEIGERSFAQLPEDCAAQQRLVAAVVSLAIENWRSEMEPRKAHGRRRSSEKRRSAIKRRSSKRERQARTDLDPLQLPVATGEEDRRESTESRADNSSRDRATTPTDSLPSDSTPTPTSRKEETRQSGQERSSTATQGQEQVDPRAIARTQARENRRRPRRREAFSMEKGAALGLLWGSLAQPGPEFQAWLAAKRSRLALRGKIHLAYGPPRRLGPAKVHTALALFAFEICGRSGSAPAGALEFWACLGWQGGSLWGGGARSDKNLQGFRPFTAPTLAVEFPLAQRKGHHVFLRLQGGANLLRTRFELQDFDGTQGIVHRYLLPAYHVGLSVGWRR